MTARLSFVLIRYVTWAELPKDRPLAQLAGDADALRRRAYKRVNTSVQRNLFLQLQRRIDTIALQSAKPGHELTFSGELVPAALELIELVLKVGPELVRDAPAMPYPNSLATAAQREGRSFLHPGAEYGWFKAILPRLEQVKFTPAQAQVRKSLLEFFRLQHEDRRALVFVLS